MVAAQELGVLPTIAPPLARACHLALWHTTHGIEHMLHPQGTSFRWDWINPAPTTLAVPKIVATQAIGAAHATPPRVATHCYLPLVRTTGGSQ